MRRARPALTPGLRHRDGSKRWQLCDVKADPGERTYVAARHPGVVKELVGAYGRCWDSAQLGLVHEDAVGPRGNLFKQAYERQFAGPESPRPAKKP